MQTSLTLVRGPDIVPDHVPSPAGALRGRFAWVARVFRDWQADRQAARDMDALLAMPDHVLRDIGVSRHEVLAARTGRRHLRRTAP